VSLDGRGGFADRELLAATLNTVHRKELLNDRA
jgi:hypothetical protein